MNIQILMSTYNGGLYIQTQLDSIVCQNIPSLSLLIRDDGSTDDTASIILEYQKRFPWISFLQGENIGVQKSFLELIKNADANADYIAFADQDDYWMPEKLSEAAEFLKKGEQLYGKDMPLLYCSAKQIVNENLKPVSVNVTQVVRRPDFGNALVQNICTGCTAVGNRALIHLLKAHPVSDSSDIIMHDWWLYLTASCFGLVYYDSNAYIRYRQHGNNTSGAMTSKKNLLKYRLAQLKKPRGEIYRQVYLFSQIYENRLRSSNMQTNKQLITKLLAANTGILNRLKAALDPRYFRQKRLDDIIFRGIVLLGKL